MSDWRKIRAILWVMFILALAAVLLPFAQYFAFINDCASDGRYTAMQCSQFFWEGNYG